MVNCQWYTYFLVFHVVSLHASSSRQFFSFWIPTNCLVYWAWTPTALTRSDTPFFFHPHLTVHTFNFSCPVYSSFSRSLSLSLSLSLSISLSRILLLFLSFFLLSPHSLSLFFLYLINFPERIFFVTFFQGQIWKPIYLVFILFVLILIERKTILLVGEIKSPEVKIPCSWLKIESAG